VGSATRRLMGLLGTVLGATLAMAGGSRGTPAEAQAMLGKAVAHYQAVGREAALADFNRRAAPFSDRDLYVICLASDHRILANGGFPAYVGSSADLLKDADGHPLGTALWEAANRHENSVHYRWLNPLSGKAEPKVSFVARVG
jgi:cytochrome c